MGPQGAGADGRVAAVGFPDEVEVWGRCLGPTDRARQRPRPLGRPPCELPRRYNWVSGVSGLSRNTPSLTLTSGLDGSVAQHDDGPWRLPPPYSPSKSTPHRFFNSSAGRSGSSRCPQYLAVQGYTGAPGHTFPRAVVEPPA